MAHSKPAAPSRPLPPPPPPSLPSVLELDPLPSPSLRVSTSSEHDSSRLGVPTRTHSRSSGRTSPQPSLSSSAPPLGPPPSLPLPDLPPFPSPINPQILNARIRSIDAPTGLRPSLARRVSEGVLVPSSPTASIRSNVESSASLTPHVSRRVASSASLGRRPPRPLSSASIWSVASANSHISAASEALGQNMAELDREADAMGILLPPSRPDSVSSRTHLSRSLGSSSGKKRRSSYRPSLPPSQSDPILSPSSDASSMNLPSPPLPSPPSAHSLRTSSSAPLLASTLRKVSLRSLYPPSHSADLPSPNEDDEAENGTGSPINSSSVQQQQSQHYRPRMVSSATRSVESPVTSSWASDRTPLPSTRSSLASSASGGSQSFHSAASSTTADVSSQQTARRGRSRQTRKAGPVAAAEAHAALEGRTSPDVTDILKTTPRPVRKRSSGSLSAVPGGSKSRSSSAAGHFRQSRSRDRERTQLDGRDDEGLGMVNLKPLRGSASMPAGALATLSEPVSVPPPLPPLSSFGRSRHQLSEIARRATEELAAMTVISPTESTGEDVWMTPDSGEGVASGTESESSIDLRTPLPQILIRDGMLSPTSTVVRSLASNGNQADSGPAGPSKDVRKRRHRDGKLLREGVGLTTGLGWSDSEDEDAPGPMRRRLSRMILRRVGSANSSLAASSAEMAATPSGFGSKTISPPENLIQEPLSSPITSSASTQVERKSILRKTSSPAALAGNTSRSTSPPMRSVLSSNPSLDAKVKALLARAEAYKKETQARMAPSAGGAPGSDPRRPTLSRSSTGTTVSSTSSSLPKTTTHGTSLSRSSFSSVKTPTVVEEVEDAALQAAEKAYRRSKELSSSFRYSGISRSSRAPRASSSIGSRDSMYSTASSTVTEFGNLTPSTISIQRNRSRALSNSNSAAPPSAFPPGMVSTTPTPSTASAKSTSASSSTLSSSTNSPVSVFASPIISTAPSSARQSLVADAQLTDDGDSSSRIAKLSNASSTSVSSAAHSTAPSLFSITSAHSTDTSFTSDGGALPSSQYLTTGNDPVNIIPPSPPGDDSFKSYNAGMLRAPKKQLPRRPSLQPLSTSSVNGADDMRNSSSTIVTADSLLASKLRKSSFSSISSRSMIAMEMEFPAPPTHTVPPVPPMPANVQTSSFSSRIRASTVPRRPSFSSSH